MSQQRFVLGLCITPEPSPSLLKEAPGLVTSLGLQRGTCGAAQPHSVSSGLIALSEQVPLLTEGCSSGDLTKPEVWCGAALLV